MKHKVCKSCSRRLPVAEFGSYETEHDKYYHTCLACRKESRAPWNLKPREWRWGHVYFLKAEGIDRYKVGYTRYNPEERVAKLNSESPITVEVVASLESPGANMLEWELHNECKDYHHHNEWYDLPKDLVERIKSAMRAANEIKPDTSLA